MSLRTLFVFAIGIGASSSARAADMTIDATATTNENNRASPSFKLTGLIGNQKLALTGWLIELKIGGTAIPPANCTLEDGNMGTTGHIHAPVNVAAGTHSVTIKVKLNDGSFVTKTANVMFQKLMEMEPPPPPPPIKE